MNKAAILVIAAMLLTGCGRQGYLAEKEFWKAEKVLSGVTKAEIQQSGLQVLDRPIQAFQKVVDKYPGSIKACESLFVISNLYLRQKNYEMARQTLSKIVSNFSREEKRVAEARNGIAQIFEVEGQWDKAEESYWQLAKASSLHPKGIFAPIHILIHYKKTGDTAGLDKAFARALDHYTSLLREIGPIDVRPVVQIHHGTAYLAYGQWEKTREIWLSIAKESADTPHAPMALIAAAELSANKGQPDKALEIYNQFLTQYPKHGLVPRVQLQIGTLLHNQKRFADARASYSAVVGNFPEKAPERAEVQFLIAKSYQDEGNWEEASKLYQEIQAQYPQSLSAMKIPLMTALHQESQDAAQAGKDLDLAIENYLKIQESSNDPAQVALAERLEQVAYVQKGEWDKVIQNFDEHLATEKLPIRKGSWLLLKAVVTEKKVSDPATAISLYKSFLTDYPKHPLAPFAQRQYDQLSKLNTGA